MEQIASALSTSPQMLAQALGEVEPTDYPPTTSHNEGDAAYVLVKFFRTHR